MAAAVEPKTPGELLKEYRKKKGWSLRFVAARAGVTHGTVDNFEKNPGGYDRLEAGTIPALARGYGMTEVKFRRILKGEVTSNSEDASGPESYRVHPDWVLLPVHAGVSAGAAEPDFLLGEVAYIPREHLRRRGARPENVDVYQVNGSCMVSDEARRVEKNFADGDYIAVDSTRAPSIGDVVVAWWPQEEKLVIKRWRVEPERVLLYPIASAHPPIVLPADEEVRILGPVVWRGG